MKWPLVLSLLLVLGLTCASSICDNADCEDPIEVNVGEEFTISLESNPSTGFAWWTDFEPANLTLTANAFIPGEVEMLGAPGVQNFTFVAEEAGETYVFMLYLRPWVNGSIVDEKIYSIEIAAESTQ